jgi:hypothetical protein
LSKPLGRLRLFLTKFATGLLFVTLQVTIFTIGGFVVLGARTGVWELGMFFAIPIVVLFFSYLFSICVLLGVLTRSTLAAIFLTLVAWFGIFALNHADGFLVRADEFYHARAENSQRQLARVNRQIEESERRVGEAQAAPEAPPALLWPFSGPTEAQKLASLKEDRARLEKEAQDWEPPGWVKAARPMVFGLNMVAPKTQDTIGLLDRALFDDAVLRAVANAAPDRGHGPIRGAMRDWRGKIERMLHGRGILWILGSSLAFEAVVLALASWRFCRQDF